MLYKEVKPQKLKRQKSSQQKSARLTCNNKTKKSTTLPALTLSALLLSPGFYVSNAYSSDVSASDVDISDVNKNAPNNGRVVGVQSYDRKALIEAIGMRDNGDVDSAVVMFNDILTDSPGATRVHLELAVAYFKQKKFQLSIEQLEMVIENNSIPSVVKINVNRLLAQARLQEDIKPKSRHRIRGNVKVIAGYDTNANAANDTADLDVGTLTTTATNDHYLGFGAKFNYSYVIPNTFELMGQPTATNITAGMSVSDKNYNEVDVANQSIVSAYSGIGLEQYGRWKTDVKVKADFIVLDHDYTARFVTVQPSFGVDTGTGFLRASPYYTKRVYVYSDDEGLEGDRTGLVVDYRTALGESASVRISLEGASTDINENWRSYDKEKLSALFIGKVSSEVMVFLLTSYEENAYQDVEENYSDKREDDVLRAVIGGNVTASSGLDLGLKFVYTDQMSNHDLHTYDRLVLETSVGYVF